MNEEDMMYMLVGKTLASCQALEMNARNYFAISKTVEKKLKEDMLLPENAFAAYDLSEFELRMTNKDSLKNFISHCSRTMEGSTPERDELFAEIADCRNEFVHKFLTNSIEQIMEKDELHRAIEDLITIKSKVERVNGIIVEALEAKHSKGLANTN